jgi:hypothetical protein
MNDERGTMNDRLMKFGRRLLRDTDGQVLLLGVIVIIALLAFMLAIPNGTHVTTQKMRAQTAADAGAFTGSVWLARALNLSANMNVGIKSMYTWMTVLTTAEALALALHNDSLDASVRALGSDVTLALFGSSDPVYTASSLYPQSIQKLAETAQWLYDLQSDVAGSFALVAQTLGTSEACRNASGGNSSSQNPGGRALVRAQYSLSLVSDQSGDSLLLHELRQFAASLTAIPTNDSNVGIAHGVTTVDSLNYSIKAYYGDSSQWCDVKQVLIRMYKKCIVQTFQNRSTGVIDTGIQYFQKSGGGPYTSYLHGDSWARWYRCAEGGTHTPFIWPNPQTYKNTAQWALLECHPTNNRYKRDTVWTKKHVIRKTDPRLGRYNYSPWVSGDSILNVCKPWVNDSGDEVDSSRAYCTDFYTGAESTSGNQGTRLRARRLDPGASLCAVSYVWRLEDDHAPYGMGPVVGRSLFPRVSAAASCPMLSVARSEPYLALPNPSVEDYFFAPNWDVRLTPLDSAGVRDICNDAAYSSHSLNSLNLADFRKYVLLP